MNTINMLHCREPESPVSLQRHVQPSAFENSNISSTCLLKVSNITLTENDWVIRLYLLRCNTISAI